MSLYLFFLDCCVFDYITNNHVFFMFQFCLSDLLHCFSLLVMIWCKSTLYPQSQLVFPFCQLHSNDSHMILLDTSVWSLHVAWFDWVCVCVCVFSLVFDLYSHWYWFCYLSVSLTRFYPNLMATFLAITLLFSHSLIVYVLCNVFICFHPCFFSCTLHGGLVSFKFLIVSFLLLFVGCVPMDRCLLFVT